MTEDFSTYTDQQLWDSMAPGWNPATRRIERPGNLALSARPLKAVHRPRTSNMMTTARKNELLELAGYGTPSKPALTLSATRRQELLASAGVRTPKPPTRYGSALALSADGGEERLTPSRRRELMAAAGYHDPNRFPKKVEDALDTLVSGSHLPATKQDRANAISIMRQLCTDQKATPEKLDMAMLEKAMKCWDREVRFHDGV